MLSVNGPQLSRTQSELTKARDEAESISFALREAHRSAANLGALAQRITQSEKVELERRKSTMRGPQTNRNDPSNDFGVTVAMKRNGTRSMVGEQKKSLLLFDTKSEFKNDVLAAEDADDDGASATSSTALQGETAVMGEETEESFDYRDLVFYLFDGFPRADLAGMFPSWYESSLWAERLNFLFVIISIIAIATETLPQYYNEDLVVFSVIEIICIAYFTLDFVARLFCTPNLSRFVRSALNWVDFVSILPFYIGLIVDAATGSGDGVAMLKYFRLLRILRVLKLSRRNVGLMAVWEALRESSEAITLLGFLMMIALLLFSSLMYYAEQYNATFDDRLHLWIRGDGKKSPFQSIFHAMWWCIVTMSTVGYGDEVPITVFGKMVGGATMVCGVFVLAFPTVILSTNFQEIHQSKVDGHMQMQQIYAAQREAARLRTEERKRRREEEVRLQQELSAEAGDGGEVERNDLAEEMGAVGSAHHSGGPHHQTIAVPMSTGSEQAGLSRAQSFARPSSFPFSFDPYADSLSQSGRPAISIRTTDIFSESMNVVKTNHIMREVVLIGDQVALYNPALHFVCRRGCLRVKVEQCLSRTVVTVKLALESSECQRAAEEAVENNRPDLYGRIMILPRPISKLKVDVVCDHPLLHDVRLQCTTFTEPAGIVPLSLVVPYPSLVSVLLANMSSLSIMTWISYEGPSAVDEPLYHYGGAVLAGTDFEEEELDHHARKLVADPMARDLPYPPPANGAAGAGHDDSAATTGTDGDGRISPAFGVFSSSTREIFGATVDATNTDHEAPPPERSVRRRSSAALGDNSDDATLFGPSSDFDNAAIRTRTNAARRMSLDVSYPHAVGVCRSPGARSPVSPFPVVGPS